MYGGGEAEEEEQLRQMWEERRQIVERYDLGREEGAVIDDWEDPKFEIYHKTDRFGFITDMRLPDADYRGEKHQKQLEKELSRLPKWLKMEKEKTKWFPRGSKNHEKMVERVWKGVPERLRGSCWSILLDLDRIKQEQVGKYQEMKELARKYSPDIRQIDLDVNRTYRDHVMFRERYNSRQQDLFHVLAAYSMFNTEVGYCQGMSQIAALLLMYLNSEEDAFWALSQLMSHPRYNMHGFFIPGFPKLIRYQDHFDKILHKKLRRLQKHLVNNSITTGLYTLKWFFQCFLDRLPFSLSIRVWDLFLLEGDIIMFAMAYTILRLHRKTLLKMGMDDLIEFLQKSLATDFRYDDDVVIEQALRENLQELRSSRLHHAGPPPDHELPQKPFGLVDISIQERLVVLGRTPVREEEKELHRNSLRREMDTAMKLSGDISINNDSMDSIETPPLNRKPVKVDCDQQRPEPEHSLVRVRTSEEERRPLSAGPGEEERPREDKRLSAAADISQFRSESSSHTRSSSLLQDSSKSSHQRRSHSRTSRLSSRTSSRLDTTGSSGVLNSSLDEAGTAQRHNERSSYYFGEAPELKDIIANVNGNGVVGVDICDSPEKRGREVGPISPHTGEVVRIRVPFTEEDSSPGHHRASEENIQRLSHQQISPSYNGHKVTIMVNRSNEALAAKHQEVSTDVSTLGKLKTSSVQNLTRKSSREKVSSENGHFSDFSRETFF